MPRSDRPPVIDTLAGMREWRAHARERRETVALVPTMGFLHEGHLSLVDRGRKHADRTVMSIFVNPTQFGPDEDFEDYPRDFERDLRLAAERGVDAVFAPGVEEMYPMPQTIWVEPGELANRLCGLSRPGHFRGVLTVVAKLLAIVEPDVAVFGRKDYQQAVLIRRMTEQLHFPVRIALAPIVREPDGLALSSRNLYLSSAERRAAVSLSEALREVRARFADGETDVSALVDRAVQRLTEAGATVEYVEVVDPAGLDSRPKADATAVCAIAASVGRTRLIDNAPLGGPSSLDTESEPAGT